MSAPQVKQFAHLHQHTAYSLLDGAARIADLMAWVKEVTPDKPTLAMTDHGNMHGAIEFYKAAQRHEVKPIIGFEAYVAAGSRFDKRRGSDQLDGGYFHLTLLAKNFKGYQNLCKLNSRAWLEGFYMKPRVDHELLAEHSEGVVALSGCLGAQIPRHLLDLGPDAGDEMLQTYLKIFGDDFFIELQNHVPGDPEAMDSHLQELAEQQTRLNPMLRHLADKYGLGMVATNDGHYVKQEDAKAHEALLAIQTKTTLSDPNRFRFPCDEFYVKTPDEMALAIPEQDFPGAIDNTMTVADMCELELPIGPKRVYQMPELPLPEGRSLAEQLRIQTYKGLMERFEAIDARVYRDYLSAGHSEAVADGEDLEKVLLELARLGESGARPPQEGAMYGHYEYPHLAAFKAAREDHDSVRILERAEFELGVIISMGFPDYFLIVADFINWAKSQRIAVGPGRGSGAGSLIAYALGITNIDPFEFDLLFERFLNPDRVSMPDFDIDFSDSRRGEVIDYVRRVYGEDKVAHIATFGTMASKAAIKDAARVMEAPYMDADRVSKLIPVVYGRSTPIGKALEEVAEIKELYDAGAREFMDVAMNLEGLTRHASVHAAGVIISRDPIQELAPVFKSGDGPQVCQYDMGSIEDLGFLKMDFLGLRTLSLIEAAVKIIKESRGVDLDPDAFPKDDPAPFDMLSRGEAAGVFQFEGGGMVDTLKKLRPRRIQDLIAVSALYRPGPMENIPTYINRHHGRESVSYKDFPASEHLLAPILEETYGIPVYQEQIMQIAQVVAGYSLGEADILRRAMGKKKLAEMARQREVFEQGAAKNDIPKAEADRIFDLLERFANYGFNKSHSAAYGVLSYQTAYLKAHYPVEFAAALLSVERANSDKVAEYVADTRSMGIEVLPPDINLSRRDFTPVEGTVRFGLYGIKNVGDGAVNHIVQERERSGPFKDLFDFCKRIDSTLVNRRAAEFLIKSGAFDALEERHVMLANLETVMKMGAAQREQAAAGQLGLFGADDLPQPSLSKAEPLSNLERLRYEKDALGLYISDHPMSSYPGLSSAASCPVADLSDWYQARCAEDGHPRQRVALTGILQNVVKKATRSGKMMARFELADESGGREVVAFSRTYEKIADLLKEEAAVMLIADVSAEQDADMRIIADRLIHWNQREHLPELAIIEFDLTEISEALLSDMRSCVDEIAGITPLKLKVRSKQGTAIYKTEGIRVDRNRLEELEQTCPWLKTTLTLDRDTLLREREPIYANQGAQKGNSSPEVPF